MYAQTNPHVWLFDPDSTITCLQASLLVTHFTMQAVQSHSSQHIHKRLEDLEEAFEDSKAERNSLSHQIEHIVEFVQGLHSILQQTQQRLDALESFQATVATHQHQLNAPEGLLNVQATVTTHQHQSSALERLSDMEQACTSHSSGSHRFVWLLVTCSVCHVSCT